MWIPEASTEFNRSKLDTSKPLGRIEIEHMAEVHISYGTLDRADNPPSKRSGDPNLVLVVSYVQMNGRNKVAHGDCKRT